MVLLAFQMMNIPPTSANGTAQPSTSQNSRELWIFHSPNWPQQCSPLSTVFDLVKATDEEHIGGPIVVVDRYVPELLLTLVFIRRRRWNRIKPSSSKLLCSKIWTSLCMELFSISRWRIKHTTAYHFDQFMSLHHLKLKSSVVDVLVEG